MAQLDTYSLPDLVGLEKDDEGCDIVVPGRPVRHKHDLKSYGVCVSRRWAFHDKPMQCEVLWSRQPEFVVGVQVNQTPITAQSRALRAKWSVEEAEPLYSAGFMSKTTLAKQFFEVEEEYENLSFDEIKALAENGADIQIHREGGVTVKRRTLEPPEPSDLNSGRIRRKTISVRR